MSGRDMAGVAIGIAGGAPLWPVSQRSELVPLKPMGLGTPYRESLTSYFQRLADSHCVPPRLLAREFVVPRLGYNNRVKHNQADRFWRSPFFNGMGEVPRSWTRILEDLTSMKGLDRLTLLPLYGRVGLQGISPTGHKWCPLCLREGLQAGVPYGQLLWEVGCVTACPRHGTKLVCTCGCTAQDRLPTLKVKFLPHVCPHCGKDLSLTPETEVELADPEELRIARSVADLLGSEAFESGMATCAAGTIADFLKAAIEVIGEGNGARVAHLLSVSKGGLSDWCNRHHVPSLPQAAHVAETFGVPLALVLQGRGTEQLEGQRPAPLLRRIVGGTKKRRLYSIDDLEGQMRSLLEAKPPISVVDAGILLNMAPRELNRLQPELARALAERFKTWRQQETAERREDCLKVVRELAMQMAYEGIIPSMKRLEARLEGVLATSFLFKERVACRRICLEARRLHLDPRVA